MQQFKHIEGKTMKYTDLEQAVLEQLGYTELDEDAIATLEDIAQYGIDGGFTGFIYYTDTVQFFEDNRVLILTELNSLASDLGESAIDLVKGFGCLDGEYNEEVEQVLMNLPCEDDTQVKDALACFAAEQVAHSLIA